MIDTIILSIPTHKATILDMTDRGVLSWDLQSRTGVYDKYIKNPSTRDKELGFYFPRLDYYRRKNDKAEWASTIKIEFSAPKLIYQNNVNELQDSDFEKVVEVLRDRLYRMGIWITQEVLETAAVRSVHYSKNIELKNGYTSQYVISEFGKINLNQRFDLTKVRYMNDGQSLCAYTTSHSFIIYDKIADLNRGSKRAIDKEQTPRQRGLFEQLNKKTEILRFEVRLSQKQKMNALFKQLGFNENPIFRDVFSAHKSKAVVTNYWNKMILNNSLLLFAHPLSPQETLQQILHARNNIKAKQSLYYTGLVLTAQSKDGLRKLRAKFEKQNHKRSWDRIMTDIKSITKDIQNLRPMEWYDQIKSALSSYKPFSTQGRIKD